MEREYADASPALVAHISGFIEDSGGRTYKNDSTCVGRKATYCLRSKV